MLKELQFIENIFFQINNHKISNLVTDNECADYFGYNFKIDKQNFKFRKAKITPTKAGQFVTLWKRNFENKTEPFYENDAFDYYIIITEEDDKFGFFIFSKAILSEKKILTTPEKEGKRGFRVYPIWTKTLSKQAEKTQAWQTKYFIDLKTNHHKSTEKIKQICNL